MVLTRIILYAKPYDYMNIEEKQIKRIKELDKFSKEKLIVEIIRLEEEIEDIHLDNAGASQ